MSLKDCRGVALTSGMLRDSRTHIYTLHFLRNLRAFLFLRSEFSFLLLIFFSDVPSKLESIDKAVV